MINTDTFLAVYQRRANGFDAETKHSSIILREGLQNTNSDAVYLWA